MPAPTPITAGLTIGRLTAIQFADRTKSGAIRWHFHCACGRTKIIAAGAVWAGRVKTCGCLQREVTIKRSTIHGESKRGRHTREYDTWLQMINRCTNRRGPNYANYGGRGIKVCRRWLRSYAAFLKDMGRRPRRGMSIDRRNNDGHYTPSNCRWATAKQQRNNQRPRNRAVRTTR